MTGYREHSFDPNAYEQPGPPLKPYNWVQWTGAGLGVLGGAMITLSLLGKIGWVPRWIEPSAAPFMMMVIGTALIGSRREPGTWVGSEQLQRNRKIFLITVAVLAIILVAAIVIEFVRS